ncbi:MAG: hypothetical protein JWO41_50 [Candidatus Saccharibacteria bacterium]|nr:hypothetical protein [Candidatus Saccharibacteria bacterium]
MIAMSHRANLKMLVLGVLLGLLGSVFSVQHAHASGLHPDPGPSGAPQYVQDYLSTCDNRYPQTGQTPAFAAWISKAGAPAVQSMSVPAGTTSVSLQFDFAGAYCIDGSKDIETRTKITSASAGVSGLVNDVLSVTFPGPGTGNNGYYDGASDAFTYSPPGGFKAGTNTYTVTIDNKVINHFNNGSYTCVSSGAGANANGGFNYQFCTAYSSDYTITVTVQPPTAIVEGIKVDESGNYQSVGDNVNAGSQYPFSDDTIIAYKSGGAQDQNDNSNAFYFSGAKVLDAGSHTFTDQARGTANTGWTLLGFTICDRDNPPPGGCTGTYLMKQSNIRTGAVNLIADHTYEMRWIYKKPGAPQGTLGLACDTATSGTATATFKDTDGPGSNTDAYIVAGGVPYTTKTNAQSGSWSGIPIGSGGTTVELWVRDMPGSGFIKVKSGTLTASGCSTGPCPASPGDSTKPVVNIPNAPSPAPGGVSTGTGDPSGRPGPSDVYYKEVPGKIRINNVYDQYNEAADWSAKGYSNNPFTLDYSNYEKDYPYDSHSTTVQYTQQYKETVFTSTIDSSCSGATWNGSSCQIPATANPYQCNAGDHNGGPGGNIIYCYHDSDNTYAGYRSYTTYSCPAGTSPSGTNCTYKEYKWQAAASSPTITSDSTWGAPKIGECYYRGVQIDQPNTTVNNINVPDDEDPGSVTYQATGAVIFNRNPSAPASASNTPRNPNSAVMTYTVHPFYSSDPSATSGPGLPGCSDDSGSMTMTVASFNQSVSQITNNSQYLSASCNGAASFAPPMNVGDYFCVSYTFTLSGNQVNQSGSYVNGASTSYTVSKCQAPITNEPYAQFFGADVSAGGKFASATGDCSTGVTAKSSVLGFLKPSPTSPARGTSSQFAALSLQTVSGFASASLRSSVPTAPNGLTFANTPALGNFNKDWCVHNYFADKPAATETAPVASDGTHIYGLTGPTTLAGLNLNPDANIAIYVNGDLTITGGITFSTSWADVADAPTLYIIVKGNIKIDPAVSRLDGVYISQNGAIDTCSISGGDRYSLCNNQLTINGAFIAQDVKLNRTWASIRNSVAGEVPGVTGDCSANGAGAAPRGYSCAAEVFNFSPEAFLGQPAIQSKSGPSSGKFDYITSLSPVL